LGPKARIPEVSQGHSEIQLNRTRLEAQVGFIPSMTSPMAERKVKNMTITDYGKKYFLVL